jgi:hypothetical protein
MGFEFRKIRKIANLFFNSYFGFIRLIFFEPQRINEDTQKLESESIFYMLPLREN